MKYEIKKKRMSVHRYRGMTVWIAGDMQQVSTLGIFLPSSLYSSSLELLNVCLRDDLGT